MVLQKDSPKVFQIMFVLKSCFNKVMGQITETLLKQGPDIFFETVGFFSEQLPYRAHGNVCFWS